MTEDIQEKAAALCDKYLSLALSTSSSVADEASAEASVRHLYKLANLAPPDRFMWFDSPYAGMLAIISMRRMQGTFISREDPAVLKIAESFRHFAEQSLQEEEIATKLNKLISENLGSHFQDVCSRNVQSIVKSKHLLSDNLDQSIIDQIVKEAASTTQAVVLQKLVPLVTAQLLAEVANDFGGRSYKNVMHLMADALLIRERNSESDDEHKTWLHISRMFDRLRRFYTAICMFVMSDLKATLNEYGIKNLGFIGDSAYAVLFMIVGYVVSSRMDQMLGKEREFLDHGEIMVRDVGWIWLFRRMAVLIRKPVRLLIDDVGRPHCSDGPAIEYADGWKIWMVHGVRIPSWIILHPEKLTINRILKCANAEVRRVMVERYGAQRFLTDAEGELLDKDERGELYLVELYELEADDDDDENGDEVELYKHRDDEYDDDDEPIVLLKVINSTMESDGTYKEYFIRVPPNMTKVQDAVAWTFSMEPTEYNPTLES